ncbi:MAG: CNP1-like family protein [Comamonadaceae bacterium]|nr:CNP1-like family protein [Comamonadaceae bacterium]
MCDSLAGKFLQRFGLFCLLIIGAAAHAELVPFDPDWQEADVPPPPVFSRDKLLPLNMPIYVTLQFGIDPATISVAPDGIVRYVVVASSTSGSVNAFYEGIRCGTGEVKTYARASNTGTWTIIKDAQWRGLSDNQPSKHAWVFARQGACEGRAVAASSAQEIIRAMKK